MLKRKHTLESMMVKEIQGEKLKCVENFQKELVIFNMIKKKVIMFINLKRNGVLSVSKLQDTLRLNVLPKN